VWHRVAPSRTRPRRCGRAAGNRRAAAPGARPRAHATKSTRGVDEQKQHASDRSARPSKQTVVQRWPAPPPPRSPASWCCWWQVGEERSRIIRARRPGTERARCRAEKQHAAPPGRRRRRGAVAARLVHEGAERLRRRHREGAQHPGDLQPRRPAEGAPRRPCLQAPVPGGALPAAVSTCPLRATLNPLPAGGPGQAAGVHLRPRQQAQRQLLQVRVRGQPPELQLLPGRAGADQGHRRRRPGPLQPACAAAAGRWLPSPSPSPAALALVAPCWGLPLALTAPPDRVPARPAPPHPRSAVHRVRLLRLLAHHRRHLPLRPGQDHRAGVRLIICGACWLGAGLARAGARAGWRGECARDVARGAAALRPLVIVSD
jgi:hypothetical protein